MTQKFMRLGGNWCVFDTPKIMSIPAMESWPFFYVVKNSCWFFFIPYMFLLLVCSRFWPNNKSRMYVLENTGELVILSLSPLMSTWPISTFRNSNLCNATSIPYLARHAPTATFRRNVLSKPKNILWLVEAHH